MKSEKLNFYRELLEQRLNVLVETSSDTVDSMTEEESLQHADPNDRASVETDRSFMLRLRDRDRRLISKIESALQRIDSGSFGECLECGEPISEARLRARPVTTLCIDCKEESELKERAV